MARELIRDYYGKIIGSIEDQGARIIARDYYGKILGSYVKSENKTRDYYGRILMTGNGLIGLIMGARP